LPSLATAKSSGESRRSVNTEAVGLVQLNPQRSGYLRFVRRECIDSRHP
jgi:hypothetical protein